MNGGEYARPAIRRAERDFEVWVGRVILAPAAERSATLNRAAYSMGRAIATRKLSAEVVALALLDVAQRVGLPTPEAVALIRAGLQTGLLARRRWP